LDEIIEKFDTQVIDNPQTNIWVIKAVPKDKKPEYKNHYIHKDKYNYPHYDTRLEIFIDYNKGVITKIDDYVPSVGRITWQGESQNFILINNIWIPTKFTTKQIKDLKVKVKEEITLSNIQLNTGIPDSEFEF
jgi:hypothetical protein